MTKLKWGMIGGGEGSQIGPAHRLGALADGRFEFAAGALDHRPEAGRAYARRLAGGPQSYWDNYNKVTGSRWDLGLSLGIEILSQDLTP